MGEEREQLDFLAWLAEEEESSCSTYISSSPKPRLERDGYGLQRGPAGLQFSEKPSAELQLAEKRRTFPSIPSSVCPPISSSPKFSAQLNLEEELNIESLLDPWMTDADSSSSSISSSQESPEELQGKAEVKAMRDVQPVSKLRRLGESTIDTPLLVGGGLLLLGLAGFFL